MSDIKSSQFNVMCNVTMRRINKDTGEEIVTHYKNRATKIALLGIAKLIYGTYSITPSESIFYTPKYIALGSNTGHSSVTVDDVKLDSELSREDYSRIEFSSRTITNPINAEYISLAFSAYIPSNSLKDANIGEAGLFSGLTDDSCFARITFTPFVKAANEVIDIKWNITLVSTVNE